MQGSGILRKKVGAGVKEKVVEGTGVDKSVRWKSAGRG